MCSLCVYKRLDISSKVNKALQELPGQENQLIPKNINPLIDIAFYNSLEAL